MNGPDASRPSRGGDELEEALARALELQDAGDPDWLLHSAPDDAALRERVAAHAAANGLVDRAFEAPRREDPGCGRVLAGRYRLDERAGSGAMGVVFAAFDLELSRKVAVKILFLGLAPRAQLLSRFERESEAAAAVQHSAIVTLFDRGTTEEGEPFLVMEWIDGVSLSDLVKAAKRNHEDDLGWLEDEFGIDSDRRSHFAQEGVRWLGQVAAGLAQVHAAGVLHRDVKPSNVMVRRDGTAALVDFGLALLEDADPLTQTGSSLGTPAYMPPEALEGARSHVVQSDVYGLGATLYYVVTTEPPYTGGPAEVIAQIATREPRPAGGVRPGLSRDLRAVLDKALARRWSSRYSTAGAMADDLERILAHRTVSARPISRAERMLRRAGRSRVLLGVALGTLAFVLLWAWRGYRRLDQDARRMQTLEVLQALPPNPTTVVESNRRWRFEKDRAALERSLGRLIELDVESVRGLLLRSSLRLDHGEPERAARDMAALSRRVGTRYIRALADRYAAAPPGANRSADIDLEGLPEPETPTDAYVAAYHAIRGRSFDEARALLSQSGVLEIHHARELSLTFTSFRGLSAEEVRQRAFEVLVDLEEHEGRLGAETATTQHLSAAFACVVGRYGSALRFAERAAELCPRAHTVRINAARAALARGNTKAAHRHLGAAEELAPRYLKLLVLRVWAYLDENRFDDALQHVDLVDERLDEPAFVLDSLRAEIETYRALEWRADVEAANRATAWHLARARTLVGLEPRGTSVDVYPSLRSGHPEQVVRALLGGLGQVPVLMVHLMRAEIEACRGLEPKAAMTAAVESAARHLARANETGAVNLDEPSFVVLLALRDGRPDRIARALFGVLERSPTDVWRIRRLLEHLPAELDADDTQALEGYLRALVRALHSEVALGATDDP